MTLAKVTAMDGLTRAPRADATLPANMRPPIPPELALWAFFEEHRRCGEIDGGAEDGAILGAAWILKPVPVVQVRQVEAIKNGADVFLNRQSWLRR